MTIATAAKSTRISSVDFKSFVIAKLIGSGIFLESATKCLIAYLRQLIVSR